MRNYQFYLLKFNSDRLKESKYKISTSFNIAKQNKELIAVADGQLLRTVRDITGKIVDMSEIHNLYRQRDKLNKEVESNVKELKKIQFEINRNLYIPDIISILIKHPSHYKHLTKYGFEITQMVHGKEKTRKFKRLSCSAGQARNSTVIFCNTEIIGEVRERINNDRDLSVKISPSKLNAYFGLCTTATKLVTEPRFIVVPDYENKIKFECNYVTETNWDIDDLVEQKMIEMTMNRNDGMGLISPSLAHQWSLDLGLDYDCCNFIIRQSFIKGLVTTFDFHKFYREKNNGNYMVKTIYKNEDGTPVMADLRECDLILSESQFKLWSSYKNLQSYIDSYHKNKLFWGVSQYSPKEYGDILTLNYQFLQTLDLNKKDIEDLCYQFEDWVNGVSSDNVYYTLLFLLGIRNTKENILNYLRSSDEYWLKSLIRNPRLIKDKYIKQKINRYIANKIKRGCLGEIIVNGNFQFLITDPYAFIQHICGQEVTGLLKEKEYYSNYWNEKDVSIVDSMRSPMTYRSEHIILNLIKNDETEEWYKHIKNGIILNWYGNEVVRYAGADMDGDIVATTDNKIMIKGIYKDELPIVYDPPKPEKIVPTEEDLINADLFSFGSQIGQITNKSTIAYSILPYLEEVYGKDSEEVKITLSRMQQCCKAQSAQIDKTKIGREVKSIPKLWIQKNKIEETDSEEVIREKQFYNETLLTKHPYFFKYLYEDTNREYNKYINKMQKSFKIQYHQTLEDFLYKKKYTTIEREILLNFYKYSPTTHYDCTMNILCKYIESIEFHIKEKIKDMCEEDTYHIYRNKGINCTSNEYYKIISLTKEEIKRAMRVGNSTYNQKDIENHLNESTENDLFDITEIYINNGYDIQKVVNCLVKYFYEEMPKSNKEFLWKNFGKYIYNNIVQNTEDILIFPFENKMGDIKYLGKRYKLEEVNEL